MTRSVTVFSPEAPLLDAVLTLQRRRISGAPVVDAQRGVVGMLSEQDCLRVLAGVVFHEEPATRRVVDAMHAPVQVVAAEDGLFSVVELFLQRELRRAPVVDAQRLVGIVTRRDLLQALKKLLLTRPESASTLDLFAAEHGTHNPIGGRPH